MATRSGAAMGACFTAMATIPFTVPLVRRLNASCHASAPPLQTLVHITSYSASFVSSKSCTSDEHTCGYTKQAHTLSQIALLNT